jgi:hypothetical protein
MFEISPLEPLATRARSGILGNRPESAPDSAIIYPCGPLNDATGHFLNLSNPLGLSINEHRLATAL